ncbi:hypothetical protein [Streptomyces sp. VNUA24]|uniref:hypothetical protein n=1 Tax=Streptomyces sp. VNUA24 TaxID=3031131 RepID=UPI0023B85F1C|nr:hypothetical protein [Streptomyces sp. VNUA24]WEH16354.1 hypothetical protein PYR72_22605 [Streptomyces sp. VNUA24]
MRTRMLRSVLVAAFSTVVAFEALSGFSGVESGDRLANGDEVSTAVVAVQPGGTADTGEQDSVWD